MSVLLIKNDDDDNDDDKWTIPTHRNESETVFGFDKQICLSHSEKIL